MTRFLLSIVISFLIVSCTDAEVSDDKDVDPADIWFDYKVWGEEETGYITIKLQFRFASQGGRSLLISPPAKVELDGKPMPVDSSQMNGIYYELTLPIQDFEGLHTITFTDKNNKKYEEKFEFQPLRLAAEPGGKVELKDFQLQLEGLEQGDRIRVILMDTASFSEGIDRVDTAKDGIVMIDSAEMATLAEGPVFLELNRERDKRLMNGEVSKGRFSMSYRLRRQFELERTP